MSMISARIERLPFARFHKRLLLMGGLGYTFDAMDAAVLAFIFPVLRYPLQFRSGPADCWTHGHVRQISSVPRIRSSPERLQ